MRYNGEYHGNPLLADKARFVTFGDATVRKKHDDFKQAKFAESGYALSSSFFLVFSFFSFMILFHFCIIYVLFLQSCTEIFYQHHTSADTFFMG